MTPAPYDVVVVGGGFAGLVGANRAAQLGCRVCLVEKGAEPDYACNSRIATGVLSVAHGDPRRTPEELYRALIEDSEGYADPALATALSGSVERAMLWMNREGAKIVRVAMGGRPRWIMAPPVPVRPGLLWAGRGPDQALRRLVRNLRQRGGDVLFSTRATGLAMKDGVCEGITIENAAGRSTIAARMTLLADGGFQASPALCERFISPDPTGLVQRNAQSGHGDALLMAEAAGARLVDTESFYGHVMAQDALENRMLWPYPTIDTLASSAIVVDRSARRFLDEGRGGIPMANTIAKLADPLSATVIFDDRQWETSGRMELIPANPFLEKLGGTIVSAPSLEVLAQKLELPADTLAATVADYNAALSADDLDRLIDPPRTPGRAFGQPRNSPRRLALHPIATPPFRAIRLCAGISYTLGGLAVDGDMRVLAREGGTLSALYAAGAATGGLEGGPLPGYLGGLLKAMTFGLLAGEAMAAERDADR